MRRFLGWLAIVLPLLSAGAASAQDMSTPIWWVDELRGGLYWHSVDNAGPGSNPLLGLLDTTRGVDVNAELLFTPIDIGDLSFLGEFRPHIGATINTNGLESMVYAGLSWTWHVFDGPVFIEGTFGGSVNNWDPANTAPNARFLGCNVLFRESASIGYDITENANIMLTVEHASHAGLCSGGNQGITNFGARVGFKF
jgi:lipid A 3-O-deacylase